MTREPPKRRIKYPEEKSNRVTVTFEWVGFEGVFRVEGVSRGLL